MNFLALMLGLAVERLLTQLFHLREFHWLDPIFDVAFRRLGTKNLVAGIVLSLGAAALLVIPVGLLELSLQDRLAQVPLFVFAVFVLLFCLGPRDLGKEIDDYRAAITNDDQEEIAKLANELLEAGSDSSSAADIEAAIYAQANNRIFAVVFWFALLGPTAAWAFRVADLMRRRAIYHIAEQAESGAEEELCQFVRGCLFLHWVLAWIPARLLMVGYTLAGSYDGAVAGWRERPAPTAELFPGPDDQRLGFVGRGAAPESDTDSVAARAEVALRLVRRTLWTIWCPALAVLTLYGWIN
ncbi:MAG: regulatory signaling modulator protein AmpE [Gammaproteobacteria bacterium]|jgi:AmpE protein|nr:regulatory signaling modulator protein AmpE [Gammaproteobacteria bacterium]MDP6617152.1 regulatory signaling modulator protein AmpE [Gammaproteobacteria bacterium]MDP6695361.1 regulatory signaling modulator protein AmpE [Gammaproteobacteria bacterium]MDP7041717.1 regulatory signaling modulator protein AmpE [Gammaproteobacteria bacterium]